MTNFDSYYTPLEHAPTPQKRKQDELIEEQFITQPGVGGVQILSQDQPDDSQLEELKIISTHKED